MLELAALLSVLIILGILDYRAMKKAKLKKELLTYLILMGFAGAFAVFYLTNPNQDSFSYMIIKLFNLKGY